jgi:hypothetical protein
MLYAGAFGIIFGIAVGQHFKAIAIGAAALAAGGCAWVVGTIAGHGFLHTACDALFLAWCLESGFFVGLVLRNLAPFDNDPASSLVRSGATSSPE